MTRSTLFYGKNRRRKLIVCLVCQRAASGTSILFDGGACK